MSVLPLSQSRSRRVFASAAAHLETKIATKPEVPRKLHAATHSTLVQRRISIGDVVAVARPTALKTLLGSCVAVCLRDPVSGIAGMNHILLPEGAREEGKTRFGVHAMEMLINEMMRLGGDRRRFVAKAFGAGNVLSCLLPPTVGDMNAQFVRNFLAVEAIPLIAERLGGESAVEVSFRTDTGKVIVRSVNGYPLSTLLAKENTYGRTPSAPSAPDEITLF